MNLAFILLRSKSFFCLFVCFLLDMMNHISNFFVGFYGSIYIYIYILNLIEENDIKMLKDNLISQSICLIKNKQKHLKYIYI